MFGNKIFSVKCALMAAVLALSFSLPAVAQGLGGCCLIAGSCKFSTSCSVYTCQCLGEELAKFNFAYEHKASGGKHGGVAVKQSSGAAHAAFVPKKDAAISAAAAVKKAVRTTTGGEAIETPRADKDHDVGYSEIIKKKDEGNQPNVLVTKDHKLGKDIVKKEHTLGEDLIKKEHTLGEDIVDELMLREDAPEKPGEGGSSGEKGGSGGGGHGY